MKGQVPSILNDSSKNGHLPVPGAWSPPDLVPQQLHKAATAIPPVYTEVDI